jgi:phage shock protein PspC (stress-responsive transcriptional regulator)
VSVAVYIIVVLRTAVGEAELEILDGVEKKYNVDMTLIRRLAEPQDEE